MGSDSKVDRGKNVFANGENIGQLVAGYGGGVAQAAILEALRLVTTQFIATLPQLETA